MSKKNVFKQYTKGLSLKELIDILPISDIEIQRLTSNIQKNIISLSKNPSLFKDPRFLSLNPWVSYLITIIPAPSDLDDTNPINMFKASSHIQEVSTIINKITSIISPSTPTSNELYVPNLLKKTIKKLRNKRNSPLTRLFNHHCNSSESLTYREIRNLLAHQNFDPSSAKLNKVLLGSINSTLEMLIAFQKLIDKVPISSEERTGINNYLHNSQREDLNIFRLMKDKLGQSRVPSNPPVVNKDPSLPLVSLPTFEQFQHLSAGELKKFISSLPSSTINPDSTPFSFDRVTPSGDLYSLKYSSSCLSLSVESYSGTWSELEYYPETNILMRKHPHHYTIHSYDSLGRTKHIDSLLHNSWSCEYFKDHKIIYSDKTPSGKKIFKNPSLNHYKSF